MDHSRFSTRMLRSALLFAAIALPSAAAAEIDISSIAIAQSNVSIGNGGGDWRVYSDAMPEINFSGGNLSVVCTGGPGDFHCDISTF